MGKLNFWQWLGVVLLIIGIVWLILRPKEEDKNKPTPAQPAPTPAQPATLPATQAGG